jgi:hypothetical protein
MELVGAGHGVDVSTVPTSRIWWPAFCPIGVQTCMFFFGFRPILKKCFVQGMKNEVSEVPWVPMVINLVFSISTRKNWFHMLMHVQHV